MKDHHKWQPNQLKRLFGIEKSKQAIFKDEGLGLIPKAHRIQRGKSQVRVWSNYDLPLIGAKYGFVNTTLKKKKIIVVYTPKGGVLKSSITFNLARILALHNIKILVVGLDVQGTITETLKGKEAYDQSKIDALSEPVPDDLYLASIGNVKIDNVIKPTDLQTLFYIPETSNLTLLEQKIRDETKREFYLKSLLEPIVDEYDVIIFDNSPNWNFLIQNSLTAATDVISPISCEVNTYHSLAQNLQIIERFKEKMSLSWNNLILVPTKVQNTRLSREIEARYRSTLSEHFNKIVSATSIRMATKAEESNLLKESIIECAPTSSIAEDYRMLVQEIWEKIN